MRGRIRLFFNIILNIFNNDGYSQAATTRKLGETASLINAKRRINQQRLDKVANDKINKILK